MGESGGAAAAEAAAARSLSEKQKTNHDGCACEWQAGRREDKWSVRNDLRPAEVWLWASDKWQAVLGAERCVAVLSCFPTHAKISTAGMLMTPSESCRPLGALQVMDALGGPHTRSCRITSQACVFISIKSVSVHAHVQTCIQDHVLFPTRMHYKH